MEGGAVKEVGQRREAGDRLTCGGNPTRLLRAALKQRG